jgi:hypothetical protein
MVELVLAFAVPTATFGLLALLALRFGKETRPGFDEKPVLDSRPNWFPIPGSAPRHPRDELLVTGGGKRLPRAGRQRAASSTRAATRPSGVWSPASTTGS